MRLRDRVTVLRGVPVPGPYGTQEPDWTVPEQVTYPAEVQPIVKPSEEALVNQDRTRTILRAFLPAMVDLQTTDRVVWAGSTYEVDGTPKHWYRGGRPHHVEVLLLRTVGG